MGIRIQKKYRVPLWGLYEKNLFSQDTVYQLSWNEFLAFAYTQVPVGFFRIHTILINFNPVIICSKMDLCGFLTACSNFESNGSK